MIYSNGFEMFREVAKHQSFTKVAVDLDVSSAAVSRQVKYLEQRLGLLLTTRLVALYDPIRLFLNPSLGLAVFGIIYSALIIVLQGLGLPVLGAVTLIAALILLFMGIVCDQISAIRIAQDQTNAALNRMKFAIRQNDGNG